VLSALRRSVERLARGMNALAGWVFAFCAFFITAEVLARNFLGFTTKSTTELSAYMLAFGIAWGLAHTLAERCHVRIDVFINRLPASWRRYLHVIALALMLVLAVAMAYGAIRLANESWEFRATDMTGIRTPLVIPQGLWAFGIAVFALLCLLLVIEMTVRLAHGEGEVVERTLSTRSYEEEAKEALDAAQEGASARGDAPAPSAGASLR
jgi:TRAP-type C4-dicarboxylate transport system permease small subunit